MPARARLHSTLLSHNMHCRIQVGIFHIETQRMYVVIVSISTCDMKLVYCFVSFGSHLAFKNRLLQSDAAATAFVILMVQLLYVCILCVMPDLAAFVSTSFIRRFLFFWLHRRGAFALFNLNLNL